MACNWLNIDGFYLGKPVKISYKGHCIQRKTSTNKILNFIYKIVFGTECEYAIPTGKIVECPVCLMMNPITFEELTGIKVI